MARYQKKSFRKSFRKYTKKNSYRSKKKNYKKYAKKTYSKYKKNKGRNEARLVASSKKLSKVETIIGNIHTDDVVILHNVAALTADELDNYNKLNELPFSIMSNIAAEVPSEIFKKDMSDYGLENSIGNPNIKFLNHQIKYDGIGDGAPGIISFYSPFSISIETIKNLTQFLTLKVEDNIELKTIIMKSVIFVGLAFGMDGSFVRVRTLFDWIGSPDTNVNLENQLKDKIKTYANASFKQVVNLWLEGLLLEPARNVCPKIFVWDNASFAPEIVSFSQAVNEGDLVHSITSAIKMICTRDGKVAPVLSSANSFLADNMGANRYKETLRFLSLCDKNITDNVIELLSGIVRTYCATEARRNEDRTMISLFFKGLKAKTIPLADLGAFDKLIKLRVMNFKFFDYKDKEVKYIPHSDANFHILYVPASVTAKVISYVERDYSSFMTLFRNIIRSERLKGELSDVGIQLFRKLAPSYNLNTILN